jgi:ABC-type dipeptide/oligopeptide/nickel transport system permease component
VKLLAITLKRLLWFIPTVAGLIAIVFFVSHVIPADPARLVAGDLATPEQVAQLRQQYGFDQPLIVQLGRYMQRVVSGNLGTSLFTNRPISEDLMHRLPATIELTLVAMLIAVGIGIPLGVICAVKRNTLLDHALRVLTVSGLAIASFWLAIILQLVFSMELRWTPLAGRIEGFAPPNVTGLLLIDALIAGDLSSFGTALSHLALPAVTLAVPGLATIVRFTRAGVLDALQSNFVLYQRAMGLPEWLIVWKYVLRSALISTVTQIGLLFGILMAGAVVVEAIFDWPGIGAYAFSSIFQSDYNAVMGFTLWAGSIFILVNLLVDLAHALIDPRSKAA